MYKILKVHLGQGQDNRSIQIYLKYKYTYENAGFCILCIDDFKILKIFNLTNYRNFPQFSPKNVVGANPPPPPPTSRLRYLVDKINM